MGFMGRLLAMFQSAPPTAEVAEFHAAADRVAEASQRVTERLEDDEPFDSFVADVRGTPRPRSKQRKKKS